MFLHAEHAGVFCGNESPDTADCQGTGSAILNPARLQVVWMKLKWMDIDSPCAQTDDKVRECLNIKF